MSLEASLSQVEQLAQYLKLLLKWNRHYNLIADTDSESAVVVHILDSVSILSLLHGERIVDVGTGAGLPGIPLAILCPQWRFTLVDSNGKKIRFIQQVIIELGLKNVEAIQSRIEEYRPPQPFDTVTARALASVSEILRQAGHLSAPQGRCLLMKGKLPTPELADLPASWQLIATHSLTVPGLQAERHVIDLRKALD
ncbi:MAG: 16S rRNA (guanine(527)-N(7))-methyltransferase RsmG [Gammaproteobacteria bacterium]|nr:16S rRNA (guanine(527)-N(7))-methyltransferase RsmG [Gammaproteobacteria bacterium]